MNNDEAKFVLRAYRPSGLDADDPAFSAALVQARHDPLLCEWFRREQALDMVVAAKLREIAPPADLREQIMAGVRISRHAHRVRSRMAAWAGIAAGLAVVLALGDLWQGRRVEAAQQRLAAFTVNDTRHGDHHAEQGALVQDLLARLGRAETALPGSLPIDLAALKRDGCRTVTFAGREAIEVCFNRDGTWYHLYVMERGSLPRRFIGRSPATLTEDGAAVAVWSDDRFDYAVVSPKGQTTLALLTA
jgi:hypothetical protein